MSGLLETGMSLVSTYIFGIVLSMIVLLALGSGSPRRLPDEVFFMAIIWPIAVPLVIAERVYHEVTA